MEILLPCMMWVLHHFCVIEYDLKLVARALLTEEIAKHYNIEDGGEHD